MKMFSTTLTMATYKVVFADNQGDFAATAYGDTLEGTVTQSVPRFDGELDLAYIQLPDENSAFFEVLMDLDNNVIEYTKVQEVL